MSSKMVLTTQSSHSGEETGCNQAEIKYARGKKTYEELSMYSKGEVKYLHIKQLSKVFQEA